MPEQAIHITSVLHSATSAACVAGGPITVEHLAFGLLTAGESRALRVLAELGVDAAALTERFRPAMHPDTERELAEPITAESFVRGLEERNRKQLTPEARALIDRGHQERDCSPSLLLALAEEGVLPVSPDDVRAELERDPLKEPETVFPPTIRKLNALIARARELKEAAVDADRYEDASAVRTREKAAMRRRAELLTEWAGEAELVAMVEEIERLRARIRCLGG